MLKEILNRVELPIYTQEGIVACVNDCLKENKKGEAGLNTQHRNIVMSNYRHPKRSGVITIEDKNKFMCEIIRYLAKSLFLEFSSSKKSFTNNEELIVNISPNFILKNPDLKYLKVNDLFDIANMSDEKLLYCKSKKTSTIDLFINITYDSFNLWDKDSLNFSEHVCSNPIYEYKAPDSNDVGVMHAGETFYSKRIYMNGAKDKKELKFILEVLKKCIDKRIPCDMKPCFGTGIDGTIYYSSNEN